MTRVTHCDAFSVSALRACAPAGVRENIRETRHNASPVIALPLDTPRCLIPFDRREGLTIEEAAEIAGKSIRTMRWWCEQHSVGRRVGGGPWVVSRVALEMLLNGDYPTLRAYLAGDRQSAAVVAHYQRVGLLDLINRWEHSGAAIPATTT